MNTESVGSGELTPYRVSSINIEESTNNIENSYLKTISFSKNTMRIIILRKDIREFVKLRNHTLTTLKTISEHNNFTTKEHLLFYSLLVFSQDIIEELLSTKWLPFYKKKSNNIDSITKAFCFWCTVELHAFMNALKNKRSWKDSFDITLEKLLLDFIKLFDDIISEDYLVELINNFNKIVSDRNGDARDLWYSQVILFANILYNGQQDYSHIFEHDIKLKLSTSLFIGEIRINAVQFIEQTVFRKEVL